MFSRNVFKDIERAIFRSHEYLGIRDEHKERILAFLNRPSLSTALSLYQFIAKVHKKDEVFDLMENLKLYEVGFKEIIPEHRDHYLHSACVYVLGLAIYNNCKIMREALSSERHLYGTVHERKTSFLFSWSLSACLHDVAYPLEMSLQSFKRYSKYLYQIEDQYPSFITISEDIYNRVNLLPILEPGNVDFPPRRKDTALGLITGDLVERSSTKSPSPITYETLLESYKTK